MQIYGGMGQFDTALGYYDQCQRILMEEIGVEPDDVTEALRSDLLARRAPTHVVAAKLAVSRLNNLPPDDTPFLGRVNELAQLTQLVSERAYRLITLLGHGGVGKTRLSIALARSQLAYFAQGAYFVSLINVHAADDVITMIADTVGLMLTGSQVPLAQLCDYLRKREVLLILDNVEQLLDDDDVVDSIVEFYRASQSSVFILTSRRRLFVRAETIFSVDGLPYPESADDEPLTKYEAPQLFVERLRRVKLNYQPEADRAEIVQICQLVDGLPLALELAATQSGMASCATVLEAIVAGMDTLKTRFRDVPARQRSLRAVFDYSWQLLSSVQQSVLAKLSTFRNGFDKNAIAAVVPEADSGLLAMLVGHSLLRQHSETERYSLHEMVRTFAAMYLANGSAEARAHADHFLNRLVEQNAALEGSQPHLAARALLPDLSNIQQAWRYAAKNGQFVSIAAATNALSNFLHVRGLFFLGRRLFTHAIAHARQSNVGSMVLPKLLTESARFYIRLAQFDEAIELAAEAQLLATNLWDQSNSINLLAEALWRKGEYKEAIQHLSPLILRLVDSSRMHRILGSAYHNNATAEVFLNNFENAQYLFEQALEIWGYLEHKRFAAITINALGVVAARRADYKRAENYYLSTLPILRELENASEIARVHLNLAVVKERQHDYALAIKYLANAISYYRDSGDRSSLGLALNNLSYNLWVCFISVTSSGKR